MNASARSLVLVLGSHPCDPAEFIGRGITLEAVEVTQLTDRLLNQACGVVFSEQSGKYGVAREYFQASFQRACAFGLLTLMASPNEADRAFFTALRDEAYAGVVPSAPWAQSDESLAKVAEKLARHEPGPQLGQAKIETLDPRLVLDGATETLMKRAFWDCDRLVVERLPGGKTARGTYRVFASLAGPLHGPQPMPFFVKIGTPRSIEEEKDHYRRRAEPFIPFHLRPALNPGRCVTAFDTAALVCDFVGSAVGLRAAWRNAQGAGTIFSLFEVTLRGLRGHTARAPKESGNLTAFLTERIRAAEIASGFNGAARIARAKALDLFREPVALEKLLIARAATIASRRGIHHGDLHCGNVMVRHQDAIVIDFGSMRDFGPITADPAVLEVSFVFGVDEADDPAAFADWKSFVDEIYLAPLQPPVHDAEHFRFAWLRKAVRELRHIGSCCDTEPDEAIVVLAGCLLRYGRLSPLEFTDHTLVRLSEERRAYALVVAERLCCKLDLNAQG